MILLIIFSAGIVCAQMNSGSKFVKGSTGLNLQTQQTKWKNDEGEQEDPDKIFNFSFTPAAAYFIKNRIAVGGFLDYSRSTTTEFIMESENKSISTNFLIGPMGRYYYGIEKLRPFGELRLGIGSEVYKSETGTGTIKSKHNLTYWGLGVGGSYLFADNISFDGLVLYDHLTAKNPDSDVNARHITGGPGIEIGITIFFDSLAQ